MPKELSREEKIELLEAANQLEERHRYNKMNDFFPDTGPFKREFYPKHVQFFQAGATHKERAFIAGNRVGKSVAGCYELTLHLTGRYPDWWEGKRFDCPTQCWAAGMTNETTRDILQRELLGIRGDYGTGMIPKDTILRTTTRPGVPDAVQDVYIRHISGGVSELGFKSYVQGVDSFMGTARHVVYFDEEMENHNIYSEALTRTMTTNGILYCTFTPLKGLSDVVLSFLPGGKMPKDGLVPATDDTGTWGQAEIEDDVDSL